MKLVVMYSIMQGTFTAVGTNIDQFFRPLGFSSTLISAMGATMILGGVFTSFFISALLAKYKKFLTTARFLICFGLLLVLFCQLTFRIDNKAVIFINLVLLAMCLIPMIPLSIAFANELSFPHDEVITNSFLLMSGMLFCFIITLVTLPVVLISPQLGMLFLTLVVLIALGFAVML